MTQQLGNEPAKSKRLRTVDCRVRNAGRSRDVTMHRGNRGDCSSWHRGFFAPAAKSGRVRICRTSKAVVLATLIAAPFCRADQSSPAVTTGSTRQECDVDDSLGPRMRHRLAAVRSSPSTTSTGVWRWYAGPQAPSKVMRCSLQTLRAQKVSAGRSPTRWPEASRLRVTFPGARAAFCTEER